MEDKKVLKEAKTIFHSLKTDPSSVSFSEERIDNKLLKKLKQSKYLKQNQLLKLTNLSNKDFLDDDKTPIRTDFVEKMEINRSTFQFRWTFSITPYWRWKFRILR